jgi:hypothetical protein
MFKKFVRITLQIIAALFCVTCAFIAFALSFWGKDLTTLQNYPARSYPQHVYDALVAAENPNYKNSFWHRNACIITSKRCGGSLRQMAIKHLTREEGPDLRHISQSLHVATALPRANATVAPSQFLD